MMAIGHGALRTIASALAGLRSIRSIQLSFDYCDFRVLTDVHMGDLLVLVLEYDRCACLFSTIRVLAGAASGCGHPLVFG